ncbi:MAG: DUF222 domain-containing protein [Acidimicrobiales bacterium]
MTDTSQTIDRAAEPDLSDEEPDLSDEELRDEMCSQAAHLAVAECQFVLLVAEFDRRELWGDGDCRSCAHWLNWRCGISLAAAREQIRVGRALEHLKKVRTEFAAGRLSYSKARAITRVASEELEDMFLYLARCATASQLEHIVREYRRADPKEGERALERHKSRYLRSYTDEEGMVVIQARLSPEDGAMVLSAIEEARRAMRQSSKPEEPPGQAEKSPGQTQQPPQDVSAETPYEVSSADALVTVCESIVGNGLETEIDEPKVSVLVHVDERVLEDQGAEGCAFVEGVGAVSSHTACRLACDAAVSKLLYKNDGSVEPEGRTQSIPKRIRRAVLARDRGCRFPGCTARKFVDVHHVVFWSKGGATKPSNLVALCRFHHRRVHEGRYRLEMSCAGAIRLWAPDGTEVPVAAEPLSPRGPGIRERNRCTGVEIDAETLEYGCNDPLDLDMTVSGLLSFRLDQP